MIKYMNGKGATKEEKAHAQDHFHCSRYDHWKCPPKWSANDLNKITHTRYTTWLIHTIIITTTFFLCYYYFSSFIISPDSLQNTQFSLCFYSPFRAIMALHRIIMKKKNSWWRINKRSHCCLCKYTNMRAERPRESEMIESAILKQ